MAVSVTTTTDPDEQQLHPWSSLAGDTEGEKIENWFERVIWTSPETCSHCFARLRTRSELERDAWGNIVEETDYHDAAIEGFDVEGLGEIGLTTVRNDDQQVVDVEILGTHSARYRAFERTTCGECGSVGGLACSDALSTSEAVDRVDELVDRLKEQGHAVDVDRVYTAVRSLKSDPDRTDNDKRIFATAAALGVKYG